MLTTQRSHVFEYSYSFCLFLPYPALSLHQKWLRNKISFQQRKTLISAEICEALEGAVARNVAHQPELSHSNMAADIRSSGDQGEKSLCPDAFVLQFGLHILSCPSAYPRPWTEPWAS